MNNDLISRSALLEQMHNHYEVRNQKQNATMDECCMMVIRAPAVDAGPKWISVEDELPKPFTDVLVYRRSVCGMGGYMSIEHMTLGYGDYILWMNDISSWKSKVTHWMPLPEPPKEG